jgi:hypothetical protein
LLALQAQQIPSFCRLWVEFINYMGRVSHGFRGRRLHYAGIAPIL